jgi:hypothetical protein
MQEIFTVGHGITTVIPPAAPPISDAELPDRPTAEEVARWIRKPLATIWLWCRTKQIPCKKAGRHYLFSKKALMSWAQPEE